MLIIDYHIIMSNTVDNKNNVVTIVIRKDTRYRIKNYLEKRKGERIIIADLIARLVNDWIEADKEATKKTTIH